MEDVGDIGVLGEGRVYLKESHLHQIIVEIVFIDDLIHDIRILEDQFHQPGVAHAVCDELIIGFLGLCRHLYLSEITILVVHIAHGALATLHRDTEPGIDLCQLHHGSAHRHHTAGHNCAAGLYGAGRVQ